MLEERLVSENSAPVSQICATGVAETPAPGNCGQVFHTARLSTEPRLTFMLPSIRSAFDEPRNITLSSLVSLRVFRLTCSSDDGRTVMMGEQ